MDRQKVALILIGCAVLLGIGSYLLVTFGSNDTAEVRQTISEVTEEVPEAPAWVDKGQSAEPDYTSSAAEAHNATPVPEPTETPTQVIEITEDKVVTFTFAESLTDFLLKRFQPTDRNGKPATLASAKALNVYYGMELMGFNAAGDDIRSARKSVLDYAFTPKMIQTLYNLYIPVFMTHLVDTAITDERDYTIGVQTERRPLTKTETAMMLKLNAVQIEQTASVLRAIAEDPSITNLAGQYIQAAKAVGRANTQLQNAIADEKDTSKPSQRLKQAILQREEVRKSITNRLKKVCPGCKDNDLFYLAQWGYRRLLNNPGEKLESFSTAAEVLVDMAGRFRSTADELM